MRQGTVTFIDIELLSPCCTALRDRIAKPGGDTAFRCGACAKSYKSTLPLTRPQARFRRPVEEPLRESKCRDEVVLWLTELGGLDPLSSEVLLAELLEAGLSQATPRGIPTFEHAMQLTPLHHE